jgi:hypothetical protein
MLGHSNRSRQRHEGYRDIVMASRSDIYAIAPPSVLLDET